MSRIPPAPLERASFSVLESGSDAIDLALWQVLRDLLLWAHTPREARRALFRVPDDRVRERMAAAADAAPLLADPLAVLARVRLLPDRVAPERLAAACQQVADWAERGGLRAVALHFAEASAYALPTEPRWAVRAGCAARPRGGAGMLARAEAWLARAFTLAVEQRDRDVALRALAGAGALMKDRGEYGEARRLYLRAARRAECCGRKRQAALALHDSFVLAAATGHVRVAVRDASAAMGDYPLHDDRIPVLAHDVASLLVRRRHYGTALRLVDGLAERVAGVSARGALLGITARAAAGAGSGARYHAAAEPALAAARADDECAGEVFVDLAEGARFWGHWEVAEGHAGRALALARRRADTEVERLAAELLRRIRRREPPPPACEPASGAPLATLARHLGERVGAWRPAPPPYAEGGGPHPGSA